MLTVASFYYMRARMWWVAGALGFFAALTRVEGVLLAGAVRHGVVRAAHQCRRDADGSSDLARRRA